VPDEAATIERIYYGSVKGDLLGIVMQRLRTWVIARVMELSEKKMLGQTAAPILSFDSETLERRS
jgi:hypothetical protein